MQATKCQCRKAKVNLLANSKPMKHVHKGRDVIVLRRPEDVSSSRVDDGLESAEQAFRKASKSGAAVVQSSEDKSNDERCQQRRRMTERRMLSI